VLNFCKCRLRASPFLAKSRVFAFAVDTVFESKRKRSPTTRTRAVLIADDDIGAEGGPQARALMRAPDGLRGLTTAFRSNLCSPCDRRQAVAWHAGSFTHRHRRVEFLAGLQHAEAKHQELAHGSDHNLLSLEAPLSLEPIDQSNDRWVVTHRR
jgi:hypothetical protein